MLYASFLLSMTACDSTSIPLEELRDEGVELPELPGRDPDEAEQEELRSLFQSLTRARSREQAPPWVRVVPAGEFQSALANYSTALRLEVEETALQLLGLLPPGESLISARSSTYQVARWDPSAGVLWVQEEAIGTPAMELGLAQSLTASCQARGCSSAALTAGGSSQLLSKLRQAPAR